uniref:Pre-rRNA-processing protein TSR1 homolog n=1 Tax=Parascaris univalens TaxID=6257 RepID=A0A915A692_PARUN
MSSVAHRPGAFKQVNKKHKTGRHRTKGSIDSEARGRQDVKALTRSMRLVRGKLARRQQANQLRANKRSAVLAEKRGLGGDNQPPFLVTVISFSSAHPAEEVVGLLCSCDDAAVRSSSEKGHLNFISAPRFKSRFVFTCPDQSSLENVLDYVKVSDLVAFAWPLDGEVSAEQELFMSCLLSHGLPTTMHFAPGLAALPTAKSKENARKNVQKLIDRWSFGDAKLMACESDSDGLLALRLISSVKKKPMIIQKRRPHLLVEKTEVVDVDGDRCTLKVSGYIRGPSLNVNGLVHLQGWGDFRMKQIDVITDPHPLNENKKRQATGDMEEMIRTVLKPDPVKQASLQSEVVPDPMDAEQTWPHQFELPKDVFESKKIIKKVPAGTSAYQAAWILDDEDEGADDENESSEDEEENENMVENAVEEEESEAEEDHIETMTVTSEMDTLESGEDKEIDMSEVEKYRKERENAQFPDEIDTPVDIPARIRFQKYRGLKSFRTSPWDPSENLPITYARIFKFADYRHSKKVALASVDELNDEGAVAHGAYVTVYIASVPSRLIETWGKDSPMVLYGLLPHEQKMSVMNMVLRKHPSCKVPILNKQKLIFHVGYRRFEAQPVFSHHTNGDKFKMERFMPSDGSFVASVFAPIMFPPASVLVFREDANGRQHVVASGGVLDVNPDRIVLKRVVLSGHPFKILKRHAVVRYMFFNREDIDWFKPVELYTPRGRRGHIREAIGTHGHMKCTFDQQLNAMDSVMMNLYKRVFPKWTYNPLIAERKCIKHLQSGEEEQMEA